MGISDSKSTHSLASALFTHTQQRLLGLLFGQPDRSFFVTELIELANVGRGSVQRELSRLSASGLVSQTKLGTQVHYQADADSPVFSELCSIISKTVGVPDVVRSALRHLSGSLELALIYGSFAKGSDRSSSDIDVLVVADDLQLEALFEVLAVAEATIGRTINPTLYTDREFAQRRDDQNSFLSRVLAGPVIMLFGEFVDE